MAARHWTESEFGSADLGDARRTERLVKVATAMSAKPGLTMGAAMNVGDSKAAYRLFGESDVTPQAILAPHQAATWGRMENEPVVLVAHDTTTLNYSTHEEAEGFGNIGGGYASNQGCFLHSSLVVNGAGVPLGVLASRQWSRDGVKTEKESVRWGAAVREISAATPQGAPRLVHLADQEGDDWALLSACGETGSSFVIRSKGDRIVRAGVSIRDLLASAPLLGSREVEVASKALRKGHGRGKWSPGNDREASDARVARVELRSRVITLPRASNRADGLSDLTVTVVSAIEVGAPPEIKDPLEWYLMTDERVVTAEDADRVVGWCRRRWAIETWHRTLKSGIKVEECRLASYDRMQRFIVLAAVLAWRIDWMTQVAREQPDTPAEALLDPLEMEALRRSSRTKNKSLLTIRDAVHQLAMLGGFAGRKSDGDPGSKTLWMGWMSLMDRVDLLQSFESQPRKVRNVGKR